MHKILIISPVPTHPQNAGNRSRIFTICDYIKKHGHELSFFYINKEKGDSVAMIEYFGDSNYFEYSSNSTLKSNLKKIFILNWFFSKVRQIISSRLINKLIPENLDLKYNRLIDDYYDFNIDLFIKENLVKNKYTHVIVEYVVYSKALDNFDYSVVKIIDTHDVLSNRYELFLEQNKIPQWYSLFPNEEAKGLNRADIILAIQNKEQHYFESISNKKVFVLGHITKILLAQKNIDNSISTIVFVGSDNKINIDGLNHFISTIFPKIVDELKSVRLLVAGTVINRKTEIIEHPNIVYHGKYKTNVEIYSLADVVIIPITYGTGLKIKTIDALSSGKAIVTFDEGISGLDKPNLKNPYCLLAKDDNDFSIMVLSILNDIELKTNLEKSALYYIESYVNDTIKVLDQIFV